MTVTWQIPHQINQTNLQAVKLGLLNLKDFQKTGQYFWNQLKVFNVGYINFGNTKGEFIGAGFENGYLRVSEKLTNRPYQIISVDDNGRRQTVVKIKPDAYPNNASWYNDAVKSRKPIWSKIYNWQDSPDVLEWLLKLAKAAKTLDDTIVLELINQIPPSETHLIKSLKDLVDNFRLDTILDLISNMAVLDDL